MASERGPCAACDRVKSLPARGLCWSCYAAARRDGTLEESGRVDLDRVSVIPPNGCHDCGTPTGKRGLCNACNRARKGLPNDVALTGGRWVRERHGILRWVAA